MNKIEFEKILKSNKDLIDKRLSDYFNKGDDRLKNPMIYATESGKRIRAILYLETLKMLGHPITDLDLDFAIALEMIHAYSLVHDDLPCMDDDDFRRGRESLHKKYGEDIALLTGDGLLTEASVLLTGISLKDNRYLELAHYVLGMAGFKGMIEGQFMDLRRPENLDLDYIKDVYTLKTVNLFKAAVVSAGMISKLSTGDLLDLEMYTYYLGLAFQIVDDLLEEEFENELNILNVVDSSEAKKLLEECNAKAKEYIKKFDNNEFLFCMIDYISVRTV